MLWFRLGWIVLARKQCPVNSYSLYVLEKQYLCTATRKRRHRREFVQTPASSQSRVFYELPPRLFVRDSSVPRFLPLRHDKDLLGIRILHFASRGVTAHV